MHDATICPMPIRVMSDPSLGIVALPISKGVLHR